MTGNAVDRADCWALLTVSDRCDACGARAVGRALLPDSDRSGDDLLLLCGHHLREHGPAVVARGGLLVVRPVDAVAAWVPPQPRDANDRTSAP
jgi:hypothetical protein